MVSTFGEKPAGVSLGKGGKIKEFIKVYIKIVLMDNIYWKLFCKGMHAQWAMAIVD